jgi:hypothetical protein
MKEQLDAKSRQALIDYRISRADETIKEAEILSKAAQFIEAIKSHLQATR